jgi:hypothetical protein
MPDKGTKRKDEIELDPKGWERFEDAVNAALRSGYRHRETTQIRKRLVARKKRHGK